MLTVVGCVGGIDYISLLYNFNIKRYELFRLLRGLR